MVDRGRRHGRPRVYPGHDETRLRGRVRPVRLESEIARSHRSAGDCSIRARFLNRLREAYGAGERIENLVMQSTFRDAVVNAESAWRRIVARGVAQGVPTVYFDALRRPLEPLAGPARLFRCPHSHAQSSHRFVRDSWIGVPGQFSSRIDDLG